MGGDSGGCGGGSGGVCGVGVSGLMLFSKILFSAFAVSLAVHDL